MIGAVVCVAACIGGDNLQDLKCGYLLGATPWKQQLMLAVGGVSSALVMAPVLSLLANAYGLGVPSEAHPNPLLAPQANLMASVARGIFGGELPWTMIGIGAAIGAVIIVLDEVLKKRESSFRVPVLACAVGIYLPIELSVPIFAGGLVAHLVERYFKVGDEPGERERIHQKGTLFSAGLITGEALMGIFIAIPIVVAGSAEVLALPEALHFGGWLGLLMLAGVAWLLYRLATRQAVGRGRVERQTRRKSRILPQRPCTGGRQGRGSILPRVSPGHRALPAPAYSFGLPRSGSPR